VSIKGPAYEDCSDFLFLECFGVKMERELDRTKRRVSKMMINNKPDSHSKIPGGIRNMANDQTLHFLLIKF
jgi:hypothetical protein